MTCMYPPPHMTCMYPPPQVASRDYRIVLKDALRLKPECDDQYGCPSYTLSGKMSTTPSNIYSNPAHAFPGFCGLHQVRQ